VLIGQIIGAMIDKTLINGVFKEKCVLQILSPFGTPRKKAAGLKYPARNVMDIGRNCATQQPAITPVVIVLLKVVAI